MDRNFLLVGLLLLVPWNVQVQEKQPDDREKLIGTWNVISFEPADLKKTGGKLVFGAERVTLDVPGEKVEATYFLRPGKMPKAMDLLFENGEEKIKVRAIYVFEGDRLKMCWCARSGLRPEEFSAKGDNPGQDLRLIVLERAKQK